MKQIVKLCAMLFCAMLWLSPAGAQQKTRIATDQVGVMIDKAVPVRAFALEQMAVADSKTSANETGKSTDFQPVAKKSAPLSRSVAKAGGERADTAFVELRMKTPAQGTVFSETNTPTFEVEVVNGEDLVWGKEPGNYRMEVLRYTEDAYTDPLDYFYARFLVENPTFTDAQALPQGKYHMIFTLMYVTDEGYNDYVLNSSGETISTEIDFTIAYGTTNDTILVMKNPARDTVYNETNTPTFEVEVINGEDLVWGTEVDNNVVWMRVYAEESYENGNPVISELYTNTVCTLPKALPKGNYRAVFYLVSMAEQQGYISFIFNAVGAVKTRVDFTINYGEVHDPELIVNDPVQGTVFSETNTPTFEVGVINGEDLVWGEEVGNTVMMMQIYTEEAYNDPNASCKRYFEPTTTFTVKQPLPQGKYHATFNLMTVAEGGYYYVRNVAGENIATEVGFTIAYGTTNDTMLVMKNPTKDTVYTKTNTPTFEVSVINGEDLVWGEEVGENIIEMLIYTEEAYNNANVNGWIVQRCLTDTVYSLAQYRSLSNGKYRAVFRLASVTQRNDNGSYNYTYLTNATGRVETGVNFTINYEGPKLRMKNPARDTVYNETNTPTFELYVLNGEDLVFGEEPGNYVMNVEVYAKDPYNAQERKVLDKLLPDTVYTLSEPLPQGKYRAKFTLMVRRQDYYAFVSNDTSTVREVNFTINYGDVRYPDLILLNPARDTVYTETNTPTFEVSVVNGEDFVFGEKPGNYMIWAQIYTEESYNTNGYSYIDQMFASTVCTFRQPFPQGKYRAIFWLLKLVDRGYYYDVEYITNLFGEVTAETAFTINYDGPDLELRMKNPAKDTVYTQTNTPTFELSVIGGESLVWGNESNNNAVEMLIYTEEAYNAGGYAMIQAYADTVYTLSKKLPQGEYRAVFTLKYRDGGIYYDVLDAAGNALKTSVKFTIEYAEPEPELRMKNPARDTIYTETNTPTFEVAVLNGEDLVWGEESGNYAVQMNIFDARGYYVDLEISPDRVFTVGNPLSRGRYRAVFSLIKYEETEDGSFTYYFVTNIAGKNIAVETGFSIDDGTPDPEFRMKNPARDTVYTETNTPTFEVSVLNGKDLSWGEEGYNVMLVQIYTEAAYKDPQGRPKEYLVYDTTFTVKQALPQGKYHAVFTLMEESRYDEGEIYRDTVFNLAGKRITAETGFTIAYGVTKDTMLVMKNPAKDTIYNETNVPTFELSVINGKDLVWGDGEGNNKMLVRIYTEAAYNAKGEPFVQEYVADTVYRVSQPLAKGDYRAVFNLMSLSEEGYYDGIYNTMGEVKAGVAFTINYADPELRMKKPTQDTVYTQTNIPAFELSVKNGENLDWGTTAGKNVVQMEIYSLTNGITIVQKYFAGTVFNLSESLPKGRYRADFYLMTVGTQADSYEYVTTLAGENITTGIYFTISYADPEFRMKKPTRDTVYAGTNTPTFEVSVINGESFIWGKKRGNKTMKVEIYTEEAYNDPQGRPREFYVENTKFTMPQALAQGKYHAVFTLMSVGAQADSYDYVTTVAGEKVTAETGFTIAYGTTQDMMLVMKSPAKDTVYNETNKPTFAVSVVNGKDLVWGTTAGKNVVRMQVYTEAAYNAKGEPFVQEYVADTVFALPQLLPQGNYRAVFNLMSVGEQEGYNHVYNASGEIKASVKFTINHGDIHNPVLTLLNPAKDTVYAETTTPTFVLSLNKGGHDISLGKGARNAAIRIEVFEAGATEALIKDFLVDTIYTLASANALDTGNYNVRFTLMQWVDETHFYYWPATERITTEVNIRVTSTEKPERMIVPTDLKTRTNQDTVWFSWTSKEERYQLCVTDASGKEIHNKTIDAQKGKTVTTVRIAKFAEGTYRWKLRAVVVDEFGSILDYSDWSETKKFTVEYIPEPPVSAVEDNLLAEVNVYPNPTAGEFKVSVPVDAMVEIYAANGRRVVARRVVAGTETFALETSGMYFVRVIADGKTAVRRIVVR